MNRVCKNLIFLLLAISLVFSLLACTEGGGSGVPDTPSVETVGLNRKTLTLTSGESFQLVATITPEGAPQEVKWKSDDKSYATVSASGLVKVSNTGNSDASVIITATSVSDPTKKASCKITIKVAPPSAFSLPNDINMVTSGPGEDASTSVVISWHAKGENSILEYKKADDAEYTSVQVSGTKTDANWADLDDSSKYFRCKKVLTGLTPNSSYEYRIKNSDGSYTSYVAHFKTAAVDTTTFQFMWMSDLHTGKYGNNYIKRLEELIDFAEKKDGVDLEFVLFSGDMVNKGQIYRQWNNWSDSKLLNDMEYAFVAGNHDYYPYGSKSRTTNAYFKDVAAYPANNDPEGDAFVLDSNYWFIWNRVMFVCIDNFTSEGSETKTKSGSTLAAQQAWFKAVVDANSGRYDYLIFCQHLPFFKDENEDKNPVPCTYGYYSDWNKIFDEYKVDYALSSDEHAYVRTRPLKNDVATELVGGKVATGTVYVTSDQTEGSSLSSLSNKAPSTSKYAAYYAGGGQAGVYFTVTPKEMTLHLIGSGGTEYDTITVLKKDRSK